jgi:uncharacterized protein YdeI (BOF family)|tara:strand:+ start:312 stop:488 length:177 start_codon:yes stop_codon:yes gene_type:complete
MKKILILLIFILINSNSFAQSKFEKDLKKISKGNAFVDNEGKAYSVQEITNYLEKLFK